jgi:polysaccharide export outer membrane protein
MSRVSRVSACAEIGVLVLSFCWTPILHAAPQSPQKAARAASEHPSPAAPAKPAPYVLQAGDEIEIKAYEAPDLNAVARIRPDGQVSLLLLDDVTAAGLTPAALDAILTTAYAKYYRNPQITVAVRSFANLNVYIGGEVGQPGLQSLTGQMTALQAVVRAGGFRDSAKIDSVILLRKGADGAAIANRLNLKVALDKGAPDVSLQPFDVVYVPKTFIAKADQFVREYIRDLLPISTNANFTYVLPHGGLINP